MATRSATTAGVAVETTQKIGEMRHITWTGLLNGDVGAAVSLAEFADKSIQFTGTFGAGGTIVLQGSNDLTSPTNWFTLTDPQTSSISKTAAALEQVIEQTVWVRPNVTAGDGTTSLTAKLLCRRGRGRAY